MLISCKLRHGHLPHQVRCSPNSAYCPSPWLLPPLLLDLFPTRKVCVGIFHKTLIPSLFLFLFYLFGGTVRGEGRKGGQVGGEGKGKIKKSEKRDNNYFSMKFCTHTKKTELQLKTLASVHRREDILK